MSQANFKPPLNWGPCARFYLQPRHQEIQRAVKMQRQVKDPKCSSFNTQKPLLSNVMSPKSICSVYFKRKFQVFAFKVNRVRKLFPVGACSSVVDLFCWCVLYLQDSDTPLFGEDDDGVMPKKSEIR